MKKTLKKLSLLVLLIVSFIACDKDYNAIGTDLLTNSSFITDSVEFPVIAYNKALDPVRSNNLGTYLLGIYNDPMYGTTTAHFVTQVVPSSYSVDFGDEPEIDSVVLTIPFFSRNTGEVDDNGKTIYMLDSVFGNSPMKFSIYRNNYFLRDYDPATNLEEQQYYYSNSNATIDFDSNSTDLIYENPAFIPNPSEIILTEYNEETEEDEETGRIAPAIREVLPKEYWEELLIYSQELQGFSNSNSFKEFYRGLYFKIEPLDGSDEGSMMLFSFPNSTSTSVPNITVYYSNIYSTTTDENGSETTERRNYEYRLNFVGNKVNVIENNFDSPLVDGDSQNGDETLFLKGIEGSMGIINLFPDPNSATEENEALNDFKQSFENRLINEANLIFYVDKDIVGDSNEPDRLYLYDLKNDTYLIDYLIDPTSNTSTPLFSRIIFSKILERDEDEHGVKYKFRITEHLNNILLRDSTNLDLGLVVSTNVNSIDALGLEGADDASTVKSIPLGAFLSPKGTALYGSNINVPEDKRVKLEIFYSENE